MKVFFELLAALLVVLLISAVATPANAACVSYTAYTTDGIVRDTPPLDKWGDQIDPPMSLSPNKGEDIATEYFVNDGDDPATPEVEQVGSSCVP